MKLFSVRLGFDLSERLVLNRNWRYSEPSFYLHFYELLIFFLTNQRKVTKLDCSFGGGFNFIYLFLNSQILRDWDKIEKAVIDQDLLRKNQEQKWCWVPQEAVKWLSSAVPT